eukprot:TRINITY_DN123_c1_g1_i1.p1 TRINITY_DN123_c1_g1~~TRINITY_DN123_c1_g1_i1.p1  ORF type:complete len:141 (-),score=38.99 TRINITY_DN123_c1_g1_i1:120-521(-)
MAPPRPLLFALTLTLLLLLLSLGYVEAAETSYWKLAGGACTTFDVPEELRTSVNPIKSTFNMTGSGPNSRMFTLGGLGVVTEEKTQFELRTFDRRLNGRASGEIVEDTLTMQFEYEAPPPYGVGYCAGLLYKR